MKRTHVLDLLKLLGICAFFAFSLSLPMMVGCPAPPPAEPTPSPTPTLAPGGPTPTPGGPTPTPGGPTPTLTPGGPTPTPGGPTPTPEPTGPEANAGVDQEVTGGTVVILDGSASTDPGGGGELQYAWSQIEGPTVILKNANTATPSFVAPNVSVTLVFELTVTNNQDQTGTDTVSITVTGTGTNLPPVADAGPDQFANAGDTVTLDGTGSVDPEGGSLTYSWTQTAGTTVTLDNATTANPSFTAPNVNEILTFQLTVSDNASLTGSATVNVFVVAPNIPKPPVANAGPDQSVDGGTNVSLNGTLSFDPEGGVLSYAWSQVAGTPVALNGATTATPSFVAPNQNEALTFQLTVTDTQGLSSTDGVTVNVTATGTDLPPVANAGPPQMVDPGASVTLNGTASLDPEGGPLTFAWTQTAGTAVILAGADTATPTFTAPTGTETLIFQLTVTDNTSQSSSATTTVSVNNQNPVANAGTDQSVQGGDNVTLDGSASTDPDGDTLTYTWTQTGGTAVTLDNASAAQAHFVAPNTTDNLTFVLTVSDGKGGSGTDTTVVSVTAMPAVLFITDDTDKVLTYTNPNTANGNLPPTTNLSGGQTQLNNPYYAVVNSAGALMVANYTGKSVTIYDNATALNGNLAPNRNIQGAATQLIAPTGMAYDRGRELLYVSNTRNPGSIVAFADATTVNGNVAPIRTITSTGVLSTPHGIFLDRADNLYVANYSNKNVLVYANVSTLNGDVAPTRIITSPAFTTGDVRDVFVDKDDNLFVVSRPVGNDQILVFRNASTRNGSIMPDVVLTVVGSQTLTGVVVDLNGTGYISDYGNGKIYSYDQIASRNGAFVPDRLISGSNTQIVAPRQLYLLER